MGTSELWKQKEISVLEIRVLDYLSYVFALFAFPRQLDENVISLNSSSLFISLELGWLYATWYIIVNCSNMSVSSLISSFVVAGRTNMSTYIHEGINNIFLLAFNHQQTLDVGWWRTCLRAKRINLVCVSIFMSSPCLFAFFLLRIGSLGTMCG